MVRGTLACRPTTIREKNSPIESGKPAFEAICAD
jgi:hypothetical protein